MKPVIHVASLSQSPVTFGIAYRQDPPPDWGDGTHTHILRHPDQMYSLPLGGGFEACARTADGEPPLDGVAAILLNRTRAAVHAVDTDCDGNPRRRYLLPGQLARFGLGPTLTFTVTPEPQSPRVPCAAGPVWTPVPGPTYTLAYRCGCDGNPSLITVSSQMTRFPERLDDLDLQPWTFAVENHFEAHGDRPASSAFSIQYPDLESAFEDARRLYRTAVDGSLEQGLQTLNSHLRHQALYLRHQKEFLALVEPGFRIPQA